MSTPERYRPIRALLILAATIVLVVGTGVLVYLSRTDSRTRYLTQRHQRAVATFAQRAKSVLENHVRVVSQALRGACRDAACRDPVARGLGSSLHENVERYLGEQVGAEGAIRVVAAESLRCPLAQVRPTLRAGFCPVRALPEETHNRARGSASQRHGRATSGQESELVLCFDLAAHVRAPATEPFEFCTATAFADLLDPLLEDSALDDVDVLLIDPEGEIRFASGPGSAHLARWPNVDGDAAPPASPGPTPVPAAHWPSLAELQQSTVARRIEAGGVKLDMLSQPLLVDLGDPTELETIRFAGVKQRASVQPAGWAFVALLPDRHLAHEGGSVPSLLVAAVSFALLLALVSPPIIKVWTIGLRDRLHLADIQLLALSVLLVAGLLTIGLLSTSTYLALRERGDRELDGAADRTLWTLRSLLENTRRELYAFAEARAKDRRDEDFLECRLAAWEGGCRRIPKSCALKLDGCRITDEWLPPPPFPLDASIVVLSDEDGNQREKWTTAARATQQVKMERFRSYTDARDGNLTSLDGANADTGFALNAQASPNSADVITLLSVPIAPAGGRRAAIAVLDTTAVGRDLPKGVEFALVKHDGQVLLHSHPHRALYENFFDECSGCAELESLTGAGGSEVIDLEYHGRSYRAAVKPLGDTPYGLIVMRDKALAQTMALEVFVVAVAVFMLGMVLLVVVVCLFIGVRDREATEWIWPRRDGRSPYLGPAIGAGILGLLSLHALIESSEVAAVTTAFCAAMLAFALLVLRVRRETPDAARWRRHDVFAGAAAVLAGGVILLAASDPSSLCVRAIVVGLASVLALTLVAPERRPGGDRFYVPALLVVGSVMAVLPAAAVFRDALADGLGRMGAIAAHQTRAVCQGYLKPDERRRLCTTPRGTAPSASDADLASLRGALVWSDRIAESIFVVAARLALISPSASGDGSNAQRASLPPPHLTRTTALAHHALPMLNAESQRFRHLDVASESGWPGLLGPLRTPGGLLVMTLAAWWAWLFVRALSRAVVGLGVLDTPRSLPRAAPPSEQLWLAPTEAELEWCRQLSASAPAGNGAPPLMAFLRGRGAPQASGLIDLRAMSDVAEIRRRTVAMRHAPTVVILHLEHRIDEPDWNAARLELLEATVFANTERTGNVVVLSEIDILPYFAGRLASPADQASAENFVSPQQMDRWIAAIDALAKRPRDLRVPDQAVTPLLEQVLAAECAWTTRLAAVKHELMSYPPRAELGRDDLVALVGDLADAHYRMLWSSCTDEERLVLHNLARDGFVSPKAWAVVRRLLARGLMRWTPALRPMNDSFRAFVRNSDADRVIREWNRVEGPSLWGRVQVGMISTFLVAGFVLYLVRPDQLTGMVGFLAALGGGAATLVQLLGMFRAGRAADAPLPR